MRFALLFLVTSSLLFAETKPVDAYPNYSVTPGVCDPRIPLTIICSQSTSERRLVTVAEKKKVAELYGIPWEKHALYEFDHLCPLELGGENVSANLWPQLWKYAHQKDKVENRLHKLVCAGKMTLSEAQETIIHSWWEYYSQKFSHTQ